jgi:uncharacterized membrane protein
VFIDPSLLPGNLLAVAWLLLALGLLAAARYTPWRILRLSPERVHLVAGGAVACLLLWLLNIRMIDGLVLHLLGVTTLTLVVGWSLALLAGAGALLAFVLAADQPWGGYPVAWLFTVALPATASWLFARALYRPRLRNPFFYILGAGFAGGALVVLVDAVAALALFSAVGLERWVDGALTFWPLLFLVMFSEGFINGMCVAALAVFYPDAVKTFDDRFYLDDA